MSRAGGMIGMVGRVKYIRCDCDALLCWHYCEV